MESIRCTSRATMDSVSMDSVPVDSDFKDSVRMDSESKTGRGARTPLISFNTSTSGAGSMRGPPGRYARPCSIASNVCWSSVSADAHPASDGVEIIPSPTTAFVPAVASFLAASLGWCAKLAVFGSSMKATVVGI